MQFTIDPVMAEICSEANEAVVRYADCRNESGAKNYMLDFTLNVLTAQPGQTHLFFLGQAGYIVKSAQGQLLGIDLYLSKCVRRVEGHMGFKRLLPRLLEPFDLNFDSLIATHSHFDHFDMDAIPQLMENMHTRLFASENCWAEVNRLMMEHNRITYVRPGDVCQAGEFKLHFIECDHGEQAPDAVGVLVTVDGKRICVVGDSSLHLERAPIYMADGPIDVLIAPINGLNGNLSEQDCASLSSVLHPRMVIPCHYGMFASHGGDPGKFKSIMDEKYPKQEYQIMAMGERMTL
nr:MBL fold metallo-hydrolase [uncultured Dysosmobacter sp.]